MPLVAPINLRVPELLIPRDRDLTSTEIIKGSEHIFVRRSTGGISG